MDVFRRNAHLSARARVRAVLAVVVLALVAVGSAVAVGSRSAVQPANSSLPSISGTTTTGSTVTANPGTWSGSTPVTFQYQWQICGAVGERCHDITGATGKDYQLKTADSGNTLRVRVIASNGEGSASAISPASGTIARAPDNLANTAAPTIGGTPSTGSTLTAAPGNWTGPGAINYHYQWVICGASGEACHDISGATSQTYVLQAADAGNTVRVTVTASNPSGSAAATSAPSARIAVAAPQPPSNGCPRTTAGIQAVAVTDVASPARLQIDQFQAIPGTIPGSMATFQVRVHAVDTCGQAVSGAQIYAAAVPYGQVSVPAETATDGSGWVTLTFNRLAGFPASRHQQLMVMFVRARKPGEPLLGGISTRRLVSFKVDLRR